MYVLAVYRKFEKCRELDLENTGNLYKKMPLRFFHSLRRLNLKGTTISTGDFGRVTSVAKRLRSLNIENCINVDESSIFKAKDCLSRLERINITTNMHFSVRAIACLCSYLSLTEVCANGILLDHTDMLFLAKTFPRLRNGDIQLETDRTISTLWILPPRMTFWRVILNLFWRFYFFYWEIVMFWEPLEQNTRERTFIIVSRQVSDQ